MCRLRLSCHPPSYRELQILYEGEQTSGLEPLTCSLRVIIHVLQGFAQGCESPIFKGFSFLRLAPCCTALRSRWCQSGINTVLLATSEQGFPRVGPTAFRRNTSRARHRLGRGVGNVVATA